MTPGPPSEVPPRTGRRSLLTAAAATLLGAAAWWWLFGMSPLILLGMLVGFLAGRTLVGTLWPAREDSGTPSWIPSAHWSLFLSLTGWGAAIGLFAFLQTAGFLRGEGASLLMILILPAAGICGLLAGPRQRRRHGGP